ARHQPEARPLEIVELFKKLLQPEGSLQRVEKAIKLSIQSAAFAEGAPKQREAAIHPRLLAGHPRSSAVIRPGIGYATPDHIAILIKNRFGRGRTEINADERLHGRLPLCRGSRAGTLLLDHLKITFEPVLDVG